MWIYDGGGGERRRKEHTSSSVQLVEYKMCMCIRGCLVRRPSLSLCSVNSKKACLCLILPRSVFCFDFGGESVISFGEGVSHIRQMVSLSLSDINI